MQPDMNQPDPHFTDFVRHGSETAFESLVTSHLGMVHAAARRLLGPARADSAADVAQAVFAQLARRASSLPPDLVVSAWLHRATIRTALNVLRTESRREARERAAAGLMEMNASDDSSEAINAALMPHIDQAIGELPDLDRQALTLCYFEKCRQQEIGERLGLSADAVQKRLTRALGKLRQRLTRRGITLSATALTLWLTDQSVQAAPATLSASSLAAGALQSAAQGTAAGGGFIQIFAMASLKSILTGTVLGLISGGLWATQASSRPPAQPGPSTNGESTAARIPSPGASGNPGAAILQRYAVPAAANTPEALMAQLRSLISAPDNEITRQRLAGWLAEVPQEMWQPLLKLACSSLPSRAGTRWLPELAAAWGKQDPLSAIMALSSMLPERDHLGSRLAASAFRAWHEASPAQAGQWMLDHQDDPRLVHTLPPIITVVAESLLTSSPGDALHWASQLQGNELREAAIYPIWAQLKERKDDAEWAGVCNFLVKGSDPEFKGLALKRMVDEWCSYGHSSSTAANAWLDSLPLASERAVAAQALLGNSLTLRTWPRQDPPATLVAALAEGDPRATADAVKAAVLKQPAAVTANARRSLLPMVPAAERGELIMNAARLLAFADRSPISKDLPLSLQWAAELTDPAIRDPLIHSIALQWREDYATGKTEGAPPQGNETGGLPESILPILRKALKDSGPALKP